METRIGGASVGNVEKVEKAGQKAECVQTIENRQSYGTKEEKRKFISESFQLDTNAILNADAKLKEAMIQLFLDNFEVLATHPSLYGETKVLEMKIDLIDTRSDPIQILSETVESGSEGKSTRSDR